MNSAPPTLLITIDTELSNFPDYRGLWGNIGTEEWGLTRLIDVFKEQEVKATFFLDPYAKDQSSLSEQRRAAELIMTSGHDLQLHTHPAPSFDHERQRLCDYSQTEQEEIIELGCKRIESWAGQRPILHRAGDWGADNRSLLALRKKGFRADFSASPWSVNCGIEAPAINGNGWAHIDGLLCGIGTHFHDRLTKRMRRLDPAGISAREIEEVFSQKINPLILTLHSFSSITYNKSRTHFTANPQYLERLRYLIARARTHWGYRIASAKEAVNEIESHLEIPLSWSKLPTSGALASCAGLIHSARNYIGT